MRFRGLVVFLPFLLVACDNSEEESVRKQLVEARAQLDSLEEKIDRLEKKGEAPRKVLEINVPKATAGAEVGNTLVIGVSTDQVNLNGQAVSTAELGERLRAAAEEDPEIQVVIQAQPDVPYTSLVNVIDQTRIVGIKQISLGTGPEPEPMPEPAPEPEQPAPAKAG
jgi:biopolymer transport protein ExbD